MKNKSVRKMLQPGSNRTIRTKSRATGVGTGVCVVKSTKAFDLITDGSGVAYGLYPIDCSSAVTHSIVLQNLAACYEFYKLRSCTVEFVPAVGTQASGRNTAAFIDNPETIAAYSAGSSSVRSTILTGSQSVETYASALPFTKVYNRGRVQSRQWYSCNYTVDYNDTATIDRSVNCCFINKVSGAGASSNMGSLVFYTTYELSGLSAGGYSTLLRAGGRGVPVKFPTDDDTTDWPEEVCLQSKLLGEALYTRSNPPVPPPQPPAPNPELLHHGFARSLNLAGCT